MSGPDSTCKPCQLKGHGITDTVFDHSTGDLICTRCGLVLQERCIDESQEWRSFATDSVEYGPKAESRCRGGDMAGIADGVTGTLQGTSFDVGKGFAGFEGLKQYQDMADHQSLKLSSSETALRKVTFRMKALTTSVKLDASILQKCNVFMNYLADKNQLGHKHDTIWYFAVIYLACREEGVSRTLREIASLGVIEDEKQTEDEFEKKMRKKVKSLEGRVALGSQLRIARDHYIDPQELMARFVSKLQLSMEVCKPAVHIVNTVQRHRDYFLADKPGMGSGQQQQCAIIASAIFIIAHVLDSPVKPKLADVAIAAKVPTTAVITAYDLLKGHAHELLPEAGSFRSRLQNITLPPALPPTPRQPIVPGLKA